MSGVQIPDFIATAVEKRWTEVNPRIRTLIPEEVQEGFYWEGSTEKITVNVYERDPSARAACIAHYGAVCVVCGFNFEEIYGPVAAGYIHVHHLVPLSQVGKSYRVDPIKDMRPVCPNCHAVIHLKKTPYPPEGVKRLICQKPRTA